MVLPLRYRQDNASNVSLIGRSDGGTLRGIGRDAIAGQPLRRDQIPSVGMGSVPAAGDLFPPLGKTPSGLSSVRLVYRLLSIFRRSCPIFTGSLMSRFSAGASASRTLTKRSAWAALQRWLRAARYKTHQNRHASRDPGPARI